jgi:NAD(P)-dependent dehydrogenase (short-subunit alcohol dehydrogenase family)
MLHTNNTGHFLLTYMLYESLMKTPNARVVNLSDVMHAYGHTDWEAATYGR